MTRNTIPMTATPESSQIGAYGYDAASKTLAVHFKRGSTVYLYRGVEPDTADKFIDSESLGRAFNEHIRGHEFTCVTPAETDARPNCSLTTTTERTP